MVQARRRVSYIIPSPSPSDSPPRLQLPPLSTSRLGLPGPLLVPYPSSSSISNHTREGGHHHPHHHHGSATEDANEPESQQQQQSPRHRLGVACLALDTSTQLVGRNAPEGILYTGGRDGLVMSWDLGIPMKKRKVDSSPSRDTDSEADPMSAGGRSRTRTRRSRRWEVLTGWDDDSFDSDGEEGDERHQQVGSDGDVLGDVVSHGDRRRRTLGSGEIPYERQWETDLGAFQPGTRTRFRQCSQAHTDWVNDILLCNYNQTVVSASSDGTVKAWNPHSATPTDPAKIGMHSDYVRCLAYCREQHWVASGSFDRTIKLWDLSRSSSSSPSSPSSPHSQAKDPTPLITLNPPDATSPKSSVYAIAADPFGRTIASGSPERVVRLWDPRTGKRTAKLVGHTDNIRAILISEDSKYLLTGSADASIKLWSLTTQRCLHTFTHHTDSVWSLSSTHPSLEVFYSGDRSGLVCRVDVEGLSTTTNTDIDMDAGGGGGDVGEGECVVLCNDSVDVSIQGGAEWDGGAGAGAGAGQEGGMGVNKLVVMDDNLLWTASGTSSVRRWHIPQRRAVRVASLSAGAAAATGGGGSAATAEVSQDGERLSSTTEFRRRTPGPAASTTTTTTPPAEAGSSRPSTGHGHSHSHSLTYNPFAQTHSTHSYSHSHSHSRSHSRRMSASPSLHSFASDHLRPDSTSHDPISLGLNPSLALNGPGNGNGNGISNGVAGIPYESLVRLVSPNEPFGNSNSFGPSASFAYYGGYGATSRGRDPEVATLYSAASVMSVPRHVAGTAGVQSIFPSSSASPPPLGSPGVVNHSRTEDTVMLSSSSSASVTQVQAQPSNSPLNPRTQTQAQTQVYTYDPLPDLASDATPLLLTPDFIIPGSAGLVRSVILNDRMHALTVDTSGKVGVWDIVRGRCVGWVGAEDVGRASVGSSATIGTTAAGGGAAGESDTHVVLEVDGEPDTGMSMGMGLERERSPREALEAVRERIEGEGVASTWCNADTKGGVLTIHLTERCFEAEVYADEVGFEGDGRFNDESKLNIGKWVLRNLFIGFIQQELKLHQSSHGHLHAQSPHTQQQQRSISRTPSRDTLDQNAIHSRFPTITPESVSASTVAAAGSGHDPAQTKRTSPNSPNSTTILSSPSMIPAVAPTISSPIRSSPLLAPLIPLHVLSRDSVSVLPSIPQSPSLNTAPASDVTPTPGVAGLSLSLHQRARSGTVDGSMMMTPLVTGGLVTPGVGGVGVKEDYFSLRTRRPSVSHAAGGIPGSPADDFSGWGSPGKPDQQPQQQQAPLLTPTPQTPSTPGGLMSRLKSFGKITKRPVSDVPNISTLTTPAAETPTQQADVLEVVPTPVQKILLSETLTPPSSMEAPLHLLPPNTTVLISEEAQPSYNVLYRRDVERVQEDVQALEETMPLWLAEYLLLNRTPAVAPLAKLSFVLMPWNKDPDVEPLPELLNTQQSKLTASRFLRVKKIVNHVQDKLERMALTAGSRSGTNSIRSSVDGQGPNQHHDHTRPRAEDEYEILCNDTVLPLGMSLAAVRQYVWRQGAELVLHYRRKRTSSLSSRPHIFN